MGIVKMDPQEERLPAVSLQPAERCIDHGVTPPFDLVDRRLIQTVEVEVYVKPAASSAP